MTDEIEENDESNLSMVSRFLLKDNIDIVNRSIWIEGTITHKNFIKFDKQLRLLEIVTKDPIRVYINTPGGDVYSMFAYIDRIRNSPNQIEMVGTGLIASAGVPILAAGHLRLATKYVQIMHHTASYSSNYNRLANNKGEYDHVSKLETKICRFLAENTEKNLSFWLSLGKHVDYYFDADKALELGLIDEII